MGRLSGQVDCRSQMYWLSGYTKSSTQSGDPLYTVVIYIHVRADLPRVGGLIVIAPQNLMLASITSIHLSSTLQNGWGVGEIKNEATGLEVLARHFNNAN